MSLNLILNNASSGLMAAQTQLRVVSDNVSNVNTPGYVRKIADQVAVSSFGRGAGVDISRIRLATDRFLQAASLNGQADAARETVRYELYDRIQSLLGDPSEGAGLFSQIEGVFSAFTPLADAPSSSVHRQEALSRLQALFNDAGRIGDQIQATRTDADTRLSSAVQSVNQLLEQIEKLNVEISRAAVSGGDTSGAESAQASLIDQLSSYMDVRVTPRPIGGVQIRTGDGLMLAGDGHATLSYKTAGDVKAETVFDEVWITEPGGSQRSLADHLKSGEIKGLLQLRDQDAPAATQRLAELVARVADELNRAHNASTATPPPNNLTGRNIGVDLQTALQGFTGETTVAVTDANGQITSRASIVFSGGTMTVNGVATTPASFLGVLNAQLGGAATASFADGRLSIQATNPNQGVAIGDSATNPSANGGRGFSHYFGLNDLVQSDRPAFYETGLTATSTHGFPAGQAITFRFANANGARLRDLTVQVPPGGTMADMLTALNSPTTGVGRYGSFSLDAQGRMAFTANGAGISLTVAGDTTSHAQSGVSMSELFGIGGGVRASRLDDFSIRPDILAASSRLSVGRLDTTAAVGSQGWAVGDGRGANALADAGKVNVAFDAAGASLGSSMSLSRYSSELAGDIGSRAATAKSRAESAGAILTEARNRQSSYEGVNIDEELVNLTTYQQAFNASARMVQAAKDLYDILLGMVR